MRDIIYERLDEVAAEGMGYILTGELLRRGFTNRQIRLLVDERRLEKVTFGVYWIVNKSLKKPKNYKAIEISMADPDAIICADSACYLHGVINREPRIFSIATRRSDRRKIEMSFPTNRFYISDSIFEKGLEEVETEYGRYYIYGVDRSVCDCFKYWKKIEPESFDLIRQKYMDKDHAEKTAARMEEYLKMLRVKLEDK